MQLLAACERGPSKKGEQWGKEGRGGFFHVLHFCTRKRGRRHECIKVLVSDHWFGKDLFIIRCGE